MNIALGHKASLALRLLILALMGIIIASPLLQPALVCGDDFPGHLAHIVERVRLLSQGVWYSRWAPDLAFGYGYPAFNFYPPAAHDAARAIHRLGLSVRDAANITLALAFLIAGPAMYLLARLLYGERAAVAAALAYTFAPYLAHNALRRFALNEALAMSLMPLALWAFGRLAADSRFPGRRIALAALVYATLILTHTLIALLLTPLLLVFLLILWWANGRPLALIGRVALASALTLGLTAFFWLPFVAEIGLVQSWRAAILDLTGELLYPLHFVSLSNLLWPKTLWPDYGFGNPLVQRLLSLPQLILAALAFALGGRSQSRWARATSALWAGALMVIVFLITPASRPLWDNFRLLQAVQFPWRFLSLASLLLALLAGVGFSNLAAKLQNLEWAIVLDAALLALLVAWVLPWLRPFTCAIDSNPSTAFLLWVDRNHIGGGSGGEFLPRWVQEPPTESPLEADLLADRPLDRLERASLPNGAQAQMLEARPLSSAWQVSSPQAFTASFNNFYFPGWGVTVDGSPVMIQPAPVTGLILAKIPAGQHLVSLHLNSTSAQTAGNVSSLVSLLIGLAVTLTPVKFQISNRKHPHCARAQVSYLWEQPATLGAQHQPHLRRTQVPASTISRREWAALAIMGVVALTVRLGLASLAPSGPTLPSTVSRLGTGLGGEVRLLGYDFSSSTLRAGEPLTVTLYWQAEHILLTSYKTFVHVTDADGNLVAQSDAVPGNWAKVTTSWLPDQWVADPHQLDIPTSVRAPLTVWAGMYDPATSQRLNSPGDESGRIKLSIINR